MTTLADIEILLKQTMGLDAESIGAPAVERAVQQRMASSHKRTLAEYGEHVRGCEPELQELIEAVVVPETWFFRDREAFAALGRIALAEWLPAHPEGRMRLLSSPSSTGEEPYTMAMALLDAGLPATRFHVDGVDISTRSLALARRAVYGRNSFRGCEHGFRDRYFEAVPHGHHLLDAVRRCVHFHHANVLDGEFLAGQSRYDVIFCRNLLIYFDRATQDRVIRKLDSLLAPKGLLFVGPAETGLMVNHQYVSAKLPMAFAFRRADAVPKVTTEKARSPEKKITLVNRPPAPKPVMPFASVPAKPAMAKPAAPSSKASLNEAERLADEGRLDEAAQCCDELLREQGPSARVLYLIGLVRDAKGKVPEAMDCYRKALYLDPHHEASLMNLAYLLEKQGDPSSARVLRTRARRAHDKKHAAAA